MFLETDELEEGDLTSEEAEEMFINWLENCADGWDYLSMKPIMIDGKKCIKWMNLPLFLNLLT